MPRLNSLYEAGATVVADASVAINLCASGAAEAILLGLPFRVAMAPDAIAEVTDDRRTGRADHIVLQRLLAAGRIEQIDLDSAEEEILAGLVIGPATETLDDGEAATIALGVTRGMTVAVDESKANGLCDRRFPALTRISSSDLFLAESVVSSLGAEAHAAALFDALRLARMRVHEQHLRDVARILGTDRLSQCSSLPRHLRPISTAHGVVVVQDPAGPL